jgi:hypothetical protein
MTLMSDVGLRRGTVVEVRSPAEILATLDDKGMVDGLPFMAEMLQFCGRRFTVDKRAEKICDTIGDYTSRRLPDSVALDDLRCDGSAHGGCQAECRLFWKEAWLKPVTDGSTLPTTTDDPATTRLTSLLAENATSIRDVNGDSKCCYTCQATELTRASYKLSTWDPRAYFREYTSGNVRLGHFLRVMARAVVEQPLRKLGWISPFPVQGTRKSGTKDPVLGLQPGERVTVRSKAEIGTTLTPQGKTRGLWFDREMVPFCGGTFRVRQRLKRFIDERTGEMIELKTDSLTLDGVVCSGERSPSRWFCPRAIYPYWREAWLERADDQTAPVTPQTAAATESTETVDTHRVEQMGPAHVHGSDIAPNPEVSDSASLTAR